MGFTATSMASIDPTPQTGVRYFLTPGQAWEAMLHDCAMAQQSIYFEQYILMNDALGQRFFGLLTDKAKQGVDVHLVLDRVGSRYTYDSDLVRRLCQAGGRVQFFNKIGVQHLFQPRRWFPRNHCKNLIIDSSIAYVGSVCFAANMRDWRDTQARFTGDLVAKVEQACKTQLRNQPVSVQEGYAFIATSPKLGRNPLYAELLQRIRTARKEVLLVTPYFLPPRRLLRVLCNAADRGVTVRVMLSHQSDVRIADYASQTYYPRLLRHGIQILHYHKTILHAKYAVIDDDWATVGSSNLDYLSLLRNRESNLVISNTTGVSHLRNHFQDDLRFCTRITRDDYKRIPQLHKLIGAIGHMFRWVL